jgi:thiamine-monophosphate kinase
MESTQRTEIASLGEFGLINRLTGHYQPTRSSTIKGIGDDAAVLQLGSDQTIISTDILAEGIHFDLAYTPLKHLGYKAVVVNLSDLYAMNGTPTHVTVSLALSNRFSVEAVEEIYAGIYLACQKYGVDLVGGDTTASPRGLFISVTAVGTVAPEKATYRNTAKVGDLICISGDLGAAYLGLQLLEREKQVWLSHPEMQPELNEKAYLVERFLKPEARKDIVAALAGVGVVPTSMMDISDGLASELHHICQQSQVGAYLEESGIPIHPEAQLQAIDFNLDPVTCALSGGEDYELLFTIRPEDVDRIKYLPDLYIAGEITDQADGIRLHTKGGNIHTITAQGWQHFGKQ